MGSRPNRVQIGEGVWFTSIIDPKFKSNRISLNLAAPLKKETAADMAALSLLLRKSCRAYPNITLLSSRLSELYGAYLDGEVRKHGPKEILNLTVQGIDNRFALEGEKMIQECAELLCQVLFAPNLEASGLFGEDDVRIERQYLVDTIDSLINDKRAYAIDRCVKSMCKGEPASVSRYGTRENALAVTPKSAADMYRHLLKTAKVEILFIGCGDPSGAKEAFKEAFAKVNRTPEEIPEGTVKLTAGEIQEVEETMEVMQGKLVMGFRVGDVSQRKKYNALRMMLSVFGGSPFSRLFVYVREKLSLCYYCASRYDRPTGLMMVDSGVEFEKKEAAQKEILNQLEAMRRGEFTDEEFSAARLNMVNAFQTTGDSLGSLEGYYFNQIFSGWDKTPEQDIADLLDITREEIIEAARQVSLDTIYFLKGETPETDRKGGNQDA